MVSPPGPAAGGSGVDRGRAGAGAGGGGGRSAVGPSFQPNQNTHTDAGPAQAASNQFPPPRSLYWSPHYTETRSADNLYTLSPYLPIDRPNNIFIFNIDS